MHAGRQAEEIAVADQSVWSGEAVALSEQAVRFMAQKPMHHQAAVSPVDEDVPAHRLVVPARSEMHEVSRPDGREHAVSGHAKAQATETTDTLRRQRTGAFKHAEVAIKYRLRRHSG
jgi:hypothetical protein